MYRVVSGILGWTVPAVTALAAESSAAVSRPLTGEPVGAGNYVQMVLGLVFVIGLIVGLAWFVRRMGNFQAGAAGSLKLLGGLSLGQRERVVLLQVGETQLLLGVAPGRINTLHVLDTPIETNEGTEANASFAKRLQDVIKQGIRQ